MAARGRCRRTACRFGAARRRDGVAPRGAGRCQDSRARRITSSPAFPASTGIWCPARYPRSDTPSTRSPRRRKPGLAAPVNCRHQAETRRWHGPSVAVREKADGAHRPSWGTDAVRYTSVDTATHRPAARQGDTRRDREETARQREISQLAGRLRRWWQVLGSNQRRLSRRFYRPLLPIPSHGL
jgi:hypothetical protein